MWGRQEDAPDIDRIAAIEEPDPVGAGSKMMEMLLAVLNGQPASELQVTWETVSHPGASLGPCTD